MRKRSVALAAIAAAAAVGIGAGLIQPASALAGSAYPGQPNPDRPGACKIVTHRNLDGLKTDHNGTPTDGTGSLLAHGVKVSTPNDGAKVYDTFTPSNAFALADVTRASFQTYRYPSSTDSPGIVTPSYQIEVLLSGAATPPDGWPHTTNYTTLVFEPYQAFGNDAVTTGHWQRWNALDPAGKWWSTHTLDAITGDAGQSTPETWAAILAAYPSAIGFDYTINQGSSNAGATTAFDGVAFGTKAGCVLNRWTKRVLAPTPTPSATLTTPPPSSPSATPSSYPSTGGPSPTSTPTGTPSSSAPAGTTPTDADPTTTPGDGHLPQTGMSSAPLIAGGVGAAAIVAGAVLLLASRRRRHRLQA